MSGNKRGRWHAAALAAGLLLGARMTLAQDSAPTAAEFSAGSELENYLRLLQLTGDAKWSPWSLRAFSGREIERMLPPDSAPLPWRLRATRLKQRLALAPLSVGTTINSSFPYGGNDGALWAGRGLTAGVSGAAVARVGPLSLTIAPMAFATTNSAFELLDNGAQTSLSFNDALFATVIDHPQRFGDGGFGRIDAGDTEVRVDSRFVTFGVGNAAMSWGPAVEYAFLLSNNAPGFLHAFVGTGDPVNIWIGRAHARAVWGGLAQSSQSPVTGSRRYSNTVNTGRDRLMAGMVFVFMPRLIPHLELGFARFTHMIYPSSGIPKSFWREPWPTFLKKNVASGAEAEAVERENELASLFARWTFPGSGFELYAEHGHDDWFHDLRDLVQEPDHNRSYLIGFQKVISRSPRRFGALRGEIINYQMPPLGRDRPGQGYIYTHAILRQGHTHRGQLLGSDAGAGAAAASLLAWDRYAPYGRTTVTWRRIVRAQRGEFFLTGVVDKKGTDVIHAIGTERVRTRGNMRLTLGVDLVMNLNRNFSGDAFNLNARTGVQWSPRSFRAPLN